MKKVLYFEGAGGNLESKFTDVNNHRIRTSFLSNDGKQIYIELISYEKSKHDKKIKRFPQYEIGEIITFVDFLFYVEGEEEKRIYHLERKVNFPYTKESILNFVNKNLNCSFDDMEILDMFEGYHVHGDNRTYNLMDNHVVNRERSIARRKAYEEYNEYCVKLFGEKYSAIGIQKMEDNSITVRVHVSDKKMYDAGWNPRTDRIKVIDVKY